MSLDFAHVIYDHFNRESNQLAHELAKLARLSLLMDSALEVVIPMLVSGAMILITE